MILRISKPSINSYNDVLKIVELFGNEYKEYFNTEMNNLTYEIQKTKYKNIFTSEGINGYNKDKTYDIYGRELNNSFIQIPSMMEILLSNHSVVLSDGKIIKETPEMTTHLKTNDYARDMIIGRNVYDDAGNLIRRDRGLPLSNIIINSGGKGTGKTSITEADIGDIYRSYPIDAILIFDYDNSYDLTRFAKVSGIPKGELAKICQIYKPSDGLNMSMMENVLSSYQKDYNKRVKDEVEYTCPVSGKIKKMKPICIVVEDSISAMITEGNTISEKSESGPEAFMQIYNKLSSHAVRCLGFLGGNSLIMMVSHRKPNTPAPGQSIAAKEFKSSTNAYKNLIPERLRMLAAYVIEIDKSITSSNLDSDSHPAKMYDLVSEGTTYAYINQCKLGKSRSSPENIYQWSEFYVDYKFDRALSMLDTALNNGTFDKDGMFPLAEDNNIFNVSTRSKKQCYTLKGFNDENGKPVRFDLRTAKYALRSIFDPNYGEMIMITDEQLDFASKLFKYILRMWEYKIYKPILDCNKLDSKETESLNKAINRLSALTSSAIEEDVDPSIYN